MKRLMILACLVPMAFLTGCAALGGSPSYDVNAKETMVRIVDKRIAATDVRQPGSNSVTIIPIFAGGRTLFIPLFLGGTAPTLTVYEYVVAFPGGRKFSVYSDYPQFEKGHCVKLFESAMPTYPRLAPGWECERE